MSTEDFFEEMQIHPRNQTKCWKIRCSIWRKTKNQQKILNQFFTNRGLLNIILQPWMYPGTVTNRITTGHGTITQAQRKKPRKLKARGTLNNLQYRYRPNHLWVTRTATRPYFAKAVVPSSAWHNSQTRTAGSTLAKMLQRPSHFTLQTKPLTTHWSANNACKTDCSRITSTRRTSWERTNSGVFCNDERGKIRLENSSSGTNERYIFHPRDSTW